MKKTCASDAKQSERGSVLAVSAFGMLAFLLAVGLSLDISHFYVVRAELSNAADAASLAGATALNSSPSGITLATERAVEVMNNFEFNNTGVTINPANVTFAVNFAGPYVSADAALAQAADIRFVKVDVPPKDISVAFASLALGTDEVQMSHTAIAGMSIPPNVHCEWIPLTVIDVPMEPRGIYTIRAAPGGFVSPGNYQVLAASRRGGKGVKYGIGQGVDLCAEPGEWYDVDTEPGVNAGPVREGINARFDDYGAGLSPEEVPPDVNIKENINFDQYRQSLDESTRSPENFEASDPNHNPVPYRRVVLIPIVKLSEFDSGRGQVRFDKFAAFFLQTKVDNGSGGEFKAEYIGERFQFGKGGYKPGGGPVTPELAQPVLYQ